MYRDCHHISDFRFLPFKNLFFLWLISFMGLVLAFSCGFKSTTSDLIDCFCNFSLDTLHFVVDSNSEALLVFLVTLQFFTIATLLFVRSLKKGVTSLSLVVRTMIPLHRSSSLACSAKIHLSEYRFGCCTLVQWFSLSHPTHNRKWWSIHRLSHPIVVLYIVIPEPFYNSF